MAFFLFYFIGAIGAGLRYSHSNARSELRLPPTPQLMAKPDPYPLSEAKDQTRNLMVPSWIRFRCTTTGTPHQMEDFNVMTMST